MVAMIGANTSSRVWNTVASGCSSVAESVTGRSITGASMGFTGEFGRPVGFVSSAATTLAASTLATSFAATVSAPARRNFAKRSSTGAGLDRDVELDGTTTGASIGGSDSSSASSSRSSSAMSATDMVR